MDLLDALKKSLMTIVITQYYLPANLAANKNLFTELDAVIVRIDKCQDYRDLMTLFNNKELLPINPNEHRKILNKAIAKNVLKIF